MGRLVDIGRKPDVRRRAVARGAIRLRPATIAAIRSHRVAKGDVLRTAEVAGLQAMKSTWQALPHCHPIPITAASVDLEVRRDRVLCTTSVEATYKTGVEMEALYGCSVVLLTVWDMVKSLEKDARGQYPSARIEGVRVVSKEKGASQNRRGRA